jgi:hypothetical protein
MVLRALPCGNFTERDSHMKRFAIFALLLTLGVVFGCTKPAEKAKEDPAKTPAEEPAGEKK